MSLIAIALKSIKQRGLASSLTALSVALGVGLLVCVLLIHSIVSGMFNQSASGYDLIVGPKGSGLQLVLNTVYRLSQPIENLPYKFYQELKQDKRIAAAVPFALGDVSQQGSFPIVGTLSDYFLLEYAPGKNFQVTKNSQQMTHPFDAVIGSRVAKVNGWEIGTELQLVHGGADSDDIHEEKFRIVAILQPTGTPNDRTVFVNLEGFFLVQGHEKPLDEALQRIADFEGERIDEAELINRMAAMFQKYEHLLVEQEPIIQKYPAILVMHPDLFQDHPDIAARIIQNNPDLLEAHPKLKTRFAKTLENTQPESEEGHAHEQHERHVTPDEQKEVTAILVRMNEGSRAGTRALRAIQLKSELQEGLRAQGVNPVTQINWLMTNLVGNIRTMLLVMTILIVVVSGVGIFVSIYNSMADRRREIAIMRALGASRGTVFSIILTESILLCLGGGILGMMLGHGLVLVGSPFLEARTGILLNPWVFETLELILIPILLGLASLVGFIPAMTAYRTDVAETLSD